VKTLSLSSRDTRALRIGALALTPVLAYMLLVRPYAHALDEARSRLSTERELLARERRLVSDAPEYPGRRRRASRALGTMWTRIVRGADTLSVSASLTSYVSDAAEGAGLLVEQVESRTADSTRMASLARGGLVASTVELHAQGDLERVMRFLAEMESGETFVRVDRVHVARAPTTRDAPGQETLTLSATVTGIARILAHPVRTP
jgi:type II secretory pathway component PulM